MSDDRLFDRTARAWLELGPTVAPDRVIDDALLTIESTPQERDLRIPWRTPNMSIQTRLAAAAVIGLLAIGGGFLLLGSGRQAPVVHPSPLATASPTAVSSVPSSPSARVDYSDMGGRILVEHLGNALDLSEASAPDLNPDKRRFYFMDPATMSAATSVEFLPGTPSTGKSAADVSADGRKVVFQDWAPKPKLYEANLDGTGFHQLAVNCDCQLLYPDYDPTATKVVYVRVEAGNSWLEILDLATGKTQKLTATIGPAADAVPEQPAWSPDGKTIAFSRLTWGGGQPIVGTVHYGDVVPKSGVLSLLDVATGTVRNLPIAAGQLPGDANWSPDSKTIVYTSSPASTTGSVSGMPPGFVAIVSADGKIFNSLQGWGGPTYLPDGQHILVQNNVLAIMAADGSNLLPVKVNAMDLSDGPQGFVYIAHWIPGP